jgi:inhibitor of KinA sporulation pathway (predicted exonuclease)
MSKYLNRVLVMDIEAVCTPGKYTEVISIGLTEVDLLKLQIMSSDVVYVKPTTMRIDDRTTRLTGLTQEFLEDNGKSFIDTCEILRNKFITDKKAIFGFGNFDWDVIENQCIDEKVPNPLNNNYYNLQNLIGLRSSMWGGNNSSMGLQEILTAFGLEFEGTPHCAKADSFNTAKIVVEVFKSMKLGSKHKI